MVSRISRKAIHAIETELFQAELIEDKQAAEDRKFKMHEETPKEFVKDVNTIFGDQLLDEAAKEPTLDRYLDRSPKVGQPIDYEEVVAILHRKREMFITAEQKKKEPKDE